MNKVYDPSAIEQRIFAKWEKNKVSRAPEFPKKPFSITLPPPNVTGVLHIGHALDATIPDAICRYKRLNGFDVLFTPGTDHAGIATEAKVAKVIAEKGLNRLQLGKVDFIKEIEKYSVDSAKMIHYQWSRLGALMDYSRERYTMDSQSSKAVYIAFKTLYDQGLIYRGERIINYDTKMMTALSDIEVIYKETESKMYYFSYELADGSGEKLLVATTRPETMFGDSAVVVNPKDERYKKFISKSVINPADNRIIPIIGDEYVDIEFGTGAMKCTPCHDFNDFAIGQKHGLAFINVIDYDGKIINVDGYSGMDRFEARKQLVEKLKSNGLLVKVEQHKNTVGYSERSNDIVEPLISQQWFVKMKPIAEKVLQYQASNDKVEFMPPHFEKILTHWLENIQDWCISRQIWWGHRVPVWYGENKEVVSETSPGPLYKQDDDVLDTWFSSALWPFSTIGWPNIKPELKDYYPNDLMSAGSDLVFFWITRMYFQAINLTNQKPFKKVLFHGLIRDELGRKVSKSLNNGVDLLAEIDQYGADALRFFLLANTTPGLDFRYSEEKITSARNFVNKLWNAARFIYNLKEDSQEELDIDRWFNNQLDTIIIRVNELYDNYELSLAATTLYHFVYDVFCSSYLELSKGRYNLNSLRKALKKVLILLHPLIPFITDEICSVVFNEDISNLTWVSPLNQNSVPIIENVLEAVYKVRTIVSQQFEGMKVKIYLKTSYPEGSWLTSLSKMLPGELVMTQSAIEGIDVITPVLHITLVKDITPEQAKALLLKQLEEIEMEIARAKALLANPGFVSKAPATKIAAEEEKVTRYNNLKCQICEQLKNM